MITFFSSLLALTTGLIHFISPVSLTPLSATLIFQLISHVPSQTLEAV